MYVNKIGPYDVATWCRPSVYEHGLVGLGLGLL